VVALLALLPAPALAADGLGEAFAPWAVIPFAGLLLSIALMPNFAEHFWHSNRNQLLVALGWASPVAGWLLYTSLVDHGALGHAAGHALKHAIAEYVSFMALLLSLYAISGGILLRGDLRATPTVNTVFLAIGAVVANIIGTTGASMLLIRPMLRTNAERKRTWHIPLFFIFLVSNVGGTLTPIGDPPLFLGYLRGVPFFWTLQHLWQPWLFAVSVLLVVFFVLDTIEYRKEEKKEIAADDRSVEPLAFEGAWNFLLLAGVTAAILLLSPDKDVVDFRHYYAREIVMVGLAGVSVLITPRAVRVRNSFSWAPIMEVGALFIGIFLAMIPATALLEARGGALGVTEPWQYFIATGSLSAFLDNAPTYVTFAALACGVDPTCTDANNLQSLALGDFGRVLGAISLGAVFCGAGSYIGNGPNFMVRAIAIHAGYKMPSFFGYCAWAALFLIPTFALVNVIWLL
jgi:Na+/H+ antiporter NhaD/arsenite permease-like protein